MSVEEITEIANRINGIDDYNRRIEDLVSNPEIYIEKRRAEMLTAINILSHRPPLTKTVVVDGGKTQMIAVDRKSLVPSGTVSIDEHLSKMLGILDTDPQSVVDAEIRRLELKRSRLEALVPEYIEELGDVEK